MAKTSVLLGFCMAVCAVTTAQADLPLNVEALLTANKAWRAEFNLVYANSDRRNVDSRFATLQLAPGQFITLPLVVSQARQNLDILVASAGMRYGLSADTEILARASALSRHARSQDAEGASSTHSSRFNNAWIGINRRLSADDDTPAVLGFAELALAENVAVEGNELAYGRTALLGITVYRTTDPLVLSITGGYQYSAARDTAEQSVDPGDLLFINPNIGFAVNHEVTLTSGMQWRWQQRERHDGQPQGIRTTQTRLELGMGYAWSRLTTVQIVGRMDMSGDAGAEIGATVIYKFPNRA